MNFKQLDLLKNSLIDWNVNYSVYPYNGYTINEVLCQFFDAINKGIVVINDYTKWVDELLNWVKAEGLKEEVVKALENMIETGKIEDIINNEIFGDINTDITELKRKVKNIVIVDSKKDLAKITDNSLVFINPKISTDHIVLSELNNVEIYCGDLQQIGTFDTNLSENKAVSEYAFIKIFKCNNIKIKNLKIHSIAECIDINHSKNIIVSNSYMTNDNNNKKVNGIVVRDSENVKIVNNEIENINILPITKNNVNPYSQGNGIACYVSNNIKIVGNKVYKCAQNGIYTFACNYVTIKTNDITYNGMSGLQLAFSTNKEHDYVIDNNKIFYNMSDGIDINNTTGVIIDINCMIKNNTYLSNGFDFNNLEFTQDGSGYATLVNVSNVIIKDNKMEGCNKFAHYISQCDNIFIFNNKGSKKKGSNNEYMYIGGSKNITVKDEKMVNKSGNDLLALDLNFGALQNIKFDNCVLYSEGGRTHYVKGSADIDITFTNTVLETFNGMDNVIKDLKYVNCTFKNMKDDVSNAFIVLDNEIILRSCKFVSKHNIMLYVPNNGKFYNCDFEGLSKTGFNVNLNCDKTLFSNCTFKGGDVGVRVDASGKNNTFNNCVFEGKRRGMEVITGTVTLINCVGISEENSIRVEEGGHANVLNWINEKGIEGFMEHKSEITFK